MHVRPWHNIMQNLTQLRSQAAKLRHDLYQFKPLLLNGTARYMLIFLGTTFLFILLVRFAWRFRKPFQEP